jgi:Tol biopolymer transport system component
MSFADLIPGQNEDRNSDIFRAYADGKGLMQLTKTDGGVDVGGGNNLAHCCPAIDYAGRTIVFVSPFDPTNGNEFLRHNELWIVNWDGSGLKRLTNTSFGQSSGAPVFDAAGRVYFVSGANWTGENPDGWGEIFRIDPQTGEVEQLSHIPGDSGPDGSGRMGVSASGLKVIFPMATSNLSGRPHMELFLLDTKTGEIAQLTLTETERGCVTASMSASGKMVAYTCEVPNQPQGGNYRVFIADVD